jgi:hypothetical protein
MEIPDDLRLCGPWITAITKTGKRFSIQIFLKYPNRRLEKILPFYGSNLRS